MVYLFNLKIIKTKDDPAEDHLNDQASILDVSLVR